MVGLEAALQLHQACALHANETIGARLWLDPRYAQYQHCQQQRHSHRYTNGDNSALLVPHNPLR